MHIPLHPEPGKQRNTVPIRLGERVLTAAADRSDTPTHAVKLPSSSCLLSGTPRRGPWNLQFRRTGALHLFDFLVDRMVRQPNCSTGGLNEGLRSERKRLGLRPVFRTVSTHEGIVQNPLHAASEGRGLAPINVGRAVADERVRLGQYNVTRGFVDQLLRLQQGDCAVCGRVHTGGRAMDIDHDHGCCPGSGSCGDCVRGLVCSNCNMHGLGWYEALPPELRTFDLLNEYLADPPAKRLRAELVLSVRQMRQAFSAHSRSAALLEKSATFLSSGSSVYW
ncbi:endonuclease domain-containing protein [Streptomyces phaeochromogenes]|uniref:endonuclease domain-containing protein n=1 Tax=Streptomyces phaeochromogenes TaxID=1923 RepID=UPI003699B28C